MRRRVPCELGDRELGAIKPKKLRVYMVEDIIAISVVRTQNAEIHRPRVAGG